MNIHQISAIQDLYDELSWYIKDLRAFYEERDGDDFKEYSGEYSLKIRPDYAKFYLDAVDQPYGSYDMTLQGLINFMLQKRGHYARLLSRGTYRKISRFNNADQWPEDLYCFRNTAEKKRIKAVEWTVICAVGKCLKENGFSNRIFIDNGFVIESPISYISTNLIGNVILNNEFITDLSNYITHNHLSESDVNGLKNIVQESGEAVCIADAIYFQQPSLAKNMLRTEIQRCTKKSECSILSREIKRITNDSELLEEVNLFKEKL